jgi:hypothetical protein
MQNRLAKCYIQTGKCKRRISQGFKSISLFSMRSRGMMYEGKMVNDQGTFSGALSFLNAMHDFHNIPKKPRIIIA